MENIKTNPNKENQSPTRPLKCLRRGKLENRVEKPLWGVTAPNSPINEKSCRTYYLQNTPS